MTKRLENKLMMMAAVLTLLKLNSKTWKDLAVLAAAIDELESMIKLIEDTRQVAEGKLTGLTEEKKAQQKKLNDKTYELASTLVSFASQLGDLFLLSVVKFPPSALQKQRERKQIKTAKSILDLLGKHSEALVAYEVTEADTTALQALIELFEKDLPTNRVSVSERKTANTKLKELFTKADNHLENQLDRLMVRYKTTHPDFYTSYLNARIIVDYGTRYEKEEEGAPVKPEATA